jgi:hypothetical protein
MNKKILIFELNDYHTEALIMFPELLSSIEGYESSEIVFYLTEKKADDAKEILKNRIETIKHTKLSQFVKKLGFNTLSLKLLTKSFIKEETPDLVLMNSIDGRRFSNVFHSIKSKKIGLIHNPLDRFKKTNFNTKNTLICCYNYFNYELLKDRFPIQGFFSPVFKNFEFEDIPKNKVPVIFIQGHIEYYRRDYLSLIDLAKQLKEKNIKLVFNIVGNSNKADGPDLKEKAANEELSPYFRFHNRLPDRDFFYQIASSDFCMPMIGEDQKRYLEGKSTHSYSHSLAYHKPIIASKDVLESFDLTHEESIVMESNNDFIDFFQNFTEERKNSLSTKLQMKQKWIIEKNRKFLSQLSKSLFFKN